MTKVGAIGTVAVFLGLAAPAGAATLTVDPGAPDGCNANTCRTITQAAGAANANDTILIRPGTYTESPNFVDNGLTVSGSGSGVALIIGTVNVNADVTLRRIGVSAQGNGSGILVPTPGAASRTVAIESSIISGAGTGAGIDATGGAAALFPTTINARHVTVADAGSAPATKLTTGLGGGAANATFTDSIVLGTTSATLNSTDTDGSAGHRAALFVDPTTENFLLRPGSPAIDAGHTAAGGESTQDVEGDTRPVGPAWDQGGDEFLNHAPSGVGLGVAPTTARPGQGVGLAVIAVTDPDQARGDQLQYRFDFGDGSSATTGQALVQHAYERVGQYTATVTAIDSSGAQSGPSNPVTISVTPSGNSPGSTAGDHTAPLVAISSPRPGQRLHRGRRAPVLRGHTSDATGVRSVEIALKRVQGRTCRWFDGRRSFVSGSCSTPRFFRVVVNDFGWSYTFRRGVNPGLGSYELRVRATDFNGNRSTAASAATRTRVAFRIVR